MPRLLRSSELWAWLSGLLLPIGGLLTAVALALSDSPPQPSPPSTTLVAGASIQAPVTAAPTATPRDSLAQTPLISPLHPTDAPALPVAQGPAAAARPDVAVAGVQFQHSQQVQGQSSPLIGTVGAGPVPLAAPAIALALTVAGFAWRVHTSAAWPSRNATRAPQPSSPQTRSAPV